MFVLISHAMTDGQKVDAVNTFGIVGFVVLPTTHWSQIPADADDITPFLQPLKGKIMREAKKDDYLFVQGDFGATVSMVNFAYKNGLTPVYATTQRNSVDTVVEDKIVTVREFKHVRYRIYEKGC